MLDAAVLLLGVLPELAVLFISLCVQCVKEDIELESGLGAGEGAIEQDQEQDGERRESLS